ERSYGLYLWHWPVFVLVVAALPDWPRMGAAGWALGGIALAITVVAATLSYRFLEQPVRKRGFKAAFRWLGPRRAAETPAAGNAAATRKPATKRTAGSPPIKQGK